MKLRCNSCCCAAYRSHWKCWNICQWILFLRYYLKTEVKICCGSASANVCDHHGTVSPVIFTAYCLCDTGKLLLWRLIRPDIEITRSKRYRNQTWALDWTWIGVDPGQAKFM